MQKKIYITIDLPDEIKESFLKEEKRWKNLNVFWTGFSHYRLVLEYFGIVDKEGVGKIRQALEESVSEIEPFDIRLDRIVLGPDAKEPRMFWATIFEDGQVKKFRKLLSGKLEAAGFSKPDTDFKPHIVLATANGNQLKGKQTNVHLRGKFKVESINLLSSQTYAKNIVKYKLIDTFPLSK
jgi:2'-5' RNA ligase